MLYWRLEPPPVHLIIPPTPAPTPVIPEKGVFCETQIGSALSGNQLWALAAKTESGIPNRSLHICCANAHVELGAFGMTGFWILTPFEAARCPVHRLGAPFPSNIRAQFLQHLHLLLHRHHVRVDGEGFAIGIDGEVWFVHGLVNHATS